MSTLKFRRTESPMRKVSVKIWVAVYKRSINSHRSRENKYKWKLIICKKKIPKGALEYINTSFGPTNLDLNISKSIGKGWGTYNWQ